MGTPRVGIIANTQKEGAGTVIEEALHVLRRREVDFLLDEASASITGREDGLPVPRLVDEVDLIILFGGDGTILHLAREMGARVKPIAAINIGNLGFLTLATAQEVERVIELLLDGTYEVSRRQMVAVTLFEQEEAKETFFALNEVSVTRGDISRLVHVNVRVDGQSLTRYSGDGVIVATPTGSTAYSLSAGGPIIEPNAGVWAITPVCTHSLSSRPVVVSSDSLIELSAPPQRDRVFLTVDGQISLPLSQEARLEIKRAGFDLPLISNPETPFFRILRQKLDWSGGLGPG